MKVLVTGGAGYIGSHAVLELLNNDYQVVVYDSLEMSTKVNLDEIEKMTGKTIDFVEGDILDGEKLTQAIKQYQPEAVMHFAAYKKVGESVENPEKYYRNNVLGAFNVLNVMKENKVDKFIFSSTCSLYGKAVSPIGESAELHPINPYARSKMFVEGILNDYFTAYKISSVALRYFNAAGADISGKIGEEVKATANIIPLIMETLMGRREKLTLFGDQFNTADGTQERDYIHVTDLAKAHVLALKKLENSKGYHFYNLGTGVSTSNKKLIEIVEQLSGKKLNYEVVGARVGDPEVLYANATKAKEELGWVAQYNVQQILQSAWNWHSSG